MDRARLLELAIAELKRQKAGIDEEIEAVRAELGSTAPTIPQTVLIPSAGTRRRRSPAARKAHSERMRKYWAAKRAQTTRPAAVAKKPAGGAKVRSWTDAEKKALSLKLKEAWKKRAAAKKAKSKSQG
jgi:hypothetical protein